MKVKSSDQNQTFNPVTFEVTIESEVELVALWAALNNSGRVLKANAWGHPLMQDLLNDGNWESCFALFKAVDDAVVARDMKK